jgi:hypothetical protein
MPDPVAPGAPAPPSVPPASGSPPSPSVPTKDTTPSPSPAASPTNPFSGLSAEEKDKILAQQAQVIRDNARKQAETDAKIKALEDRTKPAPVDPKSLAKSFYDDPVGLIRAELKEQTKPLIEFKETFEKQREYEKVKAQFKNDPKFKDFLAQPGVEGTLDQLMESLPPTQAAIYTTLVGLRGAQEFGDFGTKPTAPAAPPRDGNLTPPHLRPTPAPGPEPEKKGTDLRELDENEQRLCREWGMSKEEYLAFINEEAQKVSTSKIGKKEPVKA